MNAGPRCHRADIEHRLGHRLAPDHAAPCFRSNLIRYDIDAVFAFFVGGPAWQVVPKGGGAPYRFAGTLPTMVPVFSCLGGR